MNIMNLMNTTNMNTTSKINKQHLVPFTNTRLTKIVNVYQKQSQNTMIIGIGDYLRGCFCLVQICKKIGLEFDMYLGNHPLAAFLNISEEKSLAYCDKTQHLEDFGDMNHICINYCTYTNDSYNFYNKVITQLNSYYKSDTFFVLCNSFPIWKNIGPIGRQIVQSKILPNEQMKYYINNTLLKIGLVKNKFGLFHIRTGDKYLKDGASLSLILARKVEFILRQNMNTSLKYLVISDNNQLKMYLKQKIPNLYIYILPITHLGESNNQTYKTLRNTMLDFFIMSCSNSILSVSPHNWGSGFSEWCSVMYNIPYKRIIVTPFNN